MASHEAFLQACAARNAHAAALSKTMELYPLLPSIAFGAQKWAKYFGDVGVEPPLPGDIFGYQGRVGVFFCGHLNIKDDNIDIYGFDFRGCYNFLGLAALRKFTAVSPKTFIEVGREGWSIH